MITQSISYRKHVSHRALVRTNKALSLKKGLHVAVLVDNSRYRARGYQVRSLYNNDHNGNVTHTAESICWSVTHDEVYQQFIGILCAYIGSLLSQVGHLVIE